MCSLTGDWLGLSKVFKIPEGFSRFPKCRQHACEKRSRFWKSLRGAVTNPKLQGMNWGSNVYVGVQCDG